MNKRFSWFHRQLFNKNNRGHKLIEASSVWLPSIPVISSVSSIVCTIKAPKIFWKIYFMYDFWCTQTCSFEPFFLDYLYEFWHCCQHYIATCGKNIEVHTFCGVIFFKSHSYLYEVVRTLFRWFWTFRNFRPQFGDCGAIWQWKWELSIVPERAIPSENKGESRVKIDP